MTKFYIDSNGKFLGAFDGAIPPIGSTQVAFPPADGRMTWDGVRWIASIKLSDEINDNKRERDYVKRGASIDKLVVALWERIVEGNPEASDEIQIIREQVKTDNPK